jgi:hypothetical protein
MDSAKTGKRAVTVERYNIDRKAEFLLSTSTTAQDYARARNEVKKLRLDPDKIRHKRPQ